MSETLRLELQPFGVNVLSVTTGAVSTNGQGYFEDFELPEDSLYKSVEKTIGSRARGESDGVKRTDLKAYATKVVNDILSGTTGQVWRGNMAGSMSYVTKFAPSSLMVSVVHMIVQ